MKLSIEEQKELVHLRREYKLSELILQKKRDELENENNKLEQLKNCLNKINSQNIQNEKNISRCKEELKNLTLINEQIEKDNKMKWENLQQLLKKYNEGKPVPQQNDEANDNDNDNNNTNSSNIEDYSIEYY